MDSRELKKLSRGDLLEMLIEQMKENDRLKAELVQKDKQLADRRIEIENAGSIAQAALKLNGVFEEAQAAADQYLENIKSFCGGEGENSRNSDSDSYEKREEQIREVTEFLKKDEQRQEDQRI